MRNSEESYTRYSYVLPGYVLYIYIRGFQFLDQTYMQTVLWVCPAEVTTSIHRGSLIPVHLVVRLLLLWSHPPCIPGLFVVVQQWVALCPVTSNHTAHLNARPLLRTSQICPPASWGSLWTSAQCSYSLRQRYRPDSMNGQMGSLYGWMFQVIWIISASHTVGAERKWASRVPTRVVTREPKVVFSYRFHPFFQQKAVFFSVCTLCEITDYYFPSKIYLGRLFGEVKNK